jgi:hypothetical protein
MTDSQILISSNANTYVANLKVRWLIDCMYSEKIYSNMTLELIWICRMWTGSSMSLSMWVILILKSYNFLDIMACSPVEVSRHFRGTCHPHLQDWGTSQTRNQHEESRYTCAFFVSFSYLVYSSSVKMQVTYFSLHQWHIPEDGTLHNSLCENHKSCNTNFGLWLGYIVSDSLFSILQYWIVISILYKFKSSDFIFVKRVPLMASCLYASLTVRNSCESAENE